MVAAGIEPLPDPVFDLDILLNAPVVDLKRVGWALASDADFNRRVLHLSNVVLSRSRERAQSTTDAAILLGPCLFHTVVLLCAVTGFGPRATRDSYAELLWPHCLRMAIISERIAEESEYPVRGGAYVAGLLHDMGTLPLLMIAREEGKVFGELRPNEWRENIALEREIFGHDHCELGAWMAKSWKLPESLLDAISHHHAPHNAKNDPQLAEIVSAAEYFCPSPTRPRTDSKPRIRWARRNSASHWTECATYAQA